MQEYKLFLAGEWTATESGTVKEDLNPADGSVFANVHFAGPAEIETAISKAVEAQKEWGALLPEAREAVLLKAADYLAANMESFAGRLIAESGSAFMKTMGELEECVNIFRSAAGECRRVDGQLYPADMPGQVSAFVPQPLGVVLGIGPFNYPVLLCLNKVAPAIAVGNSFILKPSSDTPVTGLMIAECLEAAGLPKGVFSVLPMSADLAETVIADPRVKMVAFTGSTAAGKKIAVKAAENLTKCALEMGGKNPIIVLKDFDIAKAVDICAFSAYFHQGQICMAGARVIVEAPIYDAFCEAMKTKAEGIKVGPPEEVTTIVGPLIHEEKCAFIDELIADAVGKGAKVLAGGTHEGPYYAPTVVADVTTDMRIFYEECFGPIIHITKANDADDALRLCNDNAYGLSSALLTNDISTALTLAPQMESGMVHVNDSTVMGSRRAPFGGVKQSGMGREDSAFSVDEFTEKKWITIQYGDRGYPC